MILESWPWKQHLIRCAETLRRRKTQKRWPEASFVLLEREVFFSAYVIRKLAEANKLSDELESMSVTVTEYPARGLAVDHFNRDRIDQLYDLDAGCLSSASILFLCNQIIHSFVFVACFDEEQGLAGVFVVSDRDKDSRLLSLGIDEITRILVAVAEDDIVSAEWRRSDSDAPLKVVKRSSKAPTQ